MEAAGLSPRAAGSGSHYHAAAGWEEHGPRQMVTGRGHSDQIPGSVKHFGP